MKKFVSLFLAGAMVAGLAAGTVMADDDLLVYGIYKAGDQTWFIDEGEAAKNAVEALGGEFVYVDAKMNPEECNRYRDLYSGSDPFPGCSGRCRRYPDGSR